MSVRKKAGVNVTFNDICEIQMEDGTISNEELVDHELLDPEDSASESEEEEDVQENNNNNDDHETDCPILKANYAFEARYVVYWCTVRCGGCWFLRSDPMNALMRVHHCLCF
jgi:hypothetical protein